MATDRGEKPFKGSIGFVITDSKHKVLLLCYGRAAGHDPLSFRIEASAFLAALRVLFMITAYHKEGPTESIAINKRLTMFTDSESILKKLTTMNEYPTAHLQYMIDPEWDVIQ